MEPVIETAPSHPACDGDALKFVPTTLLSRFVWKYAKRRHSEKHAEKMQSNRINVVFYIQYKFLPKIIYSDVTPLQHFD